MGNKGQTKAKTLINANYKSKCSSALLILLYNITNAEFKRKTMQRKKEEGKEEVGKLKREDLSRERQRADRSRR